MKKSTKACNIPDAVKEAVWERDKQQCILCHSPFAAPHCHYISRAQLGLGIEENIFSACDTCHTAYDGEHRAAMRERIRQYLMSQYPGWDEDKLYYRKYGWEGGYK